MKLLSFFTSLFFLLNTQGDLVCENNNVQNNCVTFTVSSGTGCSWMCVIIVLIN